MTQPSTPLRALIYARISEADKKTPAVANQKANAEALAAREGYQVVGFHSDDGRSAYKQGVTRDGLVDLMLAVEDGEADVVIAMHQDRFNRDEESALAMKYLCARKGVTWHFTDTGKLDPGTAEGGFLASINAAVAHYESHIKAERIRRSVADRLAQGKDLGGPRPFGWEVDRLTERKAEADLLRAAYQGVLDGKSLRSIADAWNASGIKRDRVKDADASPGWRPQTVRNALLRERNCGRLVVKGEVYADDRPQIVSPQVFEDVKAILTHPSRTPKRGPVGQWTASGTVRCAACGSYLSLAYYKSRKKSGTVSVATLRCSPDSRPMDKRGPGHAYMRAEALEAELSNHVETEVLLHMDAPDAFAVGPVGIPALRLRIAELVQERDHVQQVAMLPGANLVLAGKRLQELAGEIAEVEQELNARLTADVAARAVDSARFLLSGFEGDGQTWEEFWQSLKVTERRELVQAVLPNPRLLPASKAWAGGFRIIWDGPYADLLGPDASA